MTDELARDMTAIEIVGQQKSDMELALNKYVSATVLNSAVGFDSRTGPQKARRTEFAAKTA